MTTYTETLPPGSYRGAASVSISTSDYSPFHRQRLKSGWSSTAFKLMPQLLITITVKEPKHQRRNDDGRWLISEESLMTKSNLLLHFVNADFFSKNYKKKGRYLEGFGCIEPQKNHQPHIHLAVTNKLPPKSLIRLKRSFEMKIKKVPLFESQGFDFRFTDTSDESYLKIGSYLAKGLNMLILSEDGLLN